jgi:hypothetical protein
MISILNPSISSSLKSLKHLKILDVLADMVPMGSYFCIFANYTVGNYIICKIKWKIKKYHIVRTVSHSNRYILETVNKINTPNTHILDPNTHILDPNTHILDQNTHILDPNTHILDPNTHILDRLLSWLGKVTSIKRGRVKPVLWAQTTSCEMKRSCKCFRHVNKIPILTHSKVSSITIEKAASKSWRYT